MNVGGHYSELRLFKAWKFWIHETSAQYKLCRKTFTVSTMSHMSSKKHSNAAGQSSRGSSSKGRMQLTSYLWKKIGMLWKNYGKAMEFLFWGSVRTLHSFETQRLCKLEDVKKYHGVSTIRQHPVVCLINTSHSRREVFFFWTRRQKKGPENSP